MMLKDKWQYITDAEGNRISVILPLNEFLLIEDTLEQRIRALGDEAKLKQMEQAANDPLFLEDLRETMDAFATPDSEWWETTK
jgi:hypothetical protein